MHKKINIFTLSLLLMLSGCQPLKEKTNSIDNVTFNKE